jgi:molybdenum cofactor biosynthesis enzyme MoaA
LVALRYAADIGAEIRFIEYRCWRRDGMAAGSGRVAEIIERLASHFGSVEPIAEQSSAPAARYRLPSGQTIGIISRPPTVLRDLRPRA